LVCDLPVFGGHVERFLHQFPEYAGWRVERVSLARTCLRMFGRKSSGRTSLVQDLDDLTAGL